MPAQQTTAHIHKGIRNSQTTIIMSENDRCSWEYHIVGIIDGRGKTVAVGPAHCRAGPGELYVTN